MHDQWVTLDGQEPITLHIREWPGARSPAHSSFVLLHGLASNSRTWDLVAPLLAANGHRVIAVDQRGHGLSDKPDAGYDFATVTGDLLALLDGLAIERPIIVGQSWGGNVVLAFGATHPGRARGLAFVDGGYIDLQSRANGDWESVAQELKPPTLAGMAAVDLTARMKWVHPEWSAAGIEATMANFEVLPDGSVRPWLTLDRHMAILRALWEQRPADLYPRVREPVYIAVAEDPSNPEWRASKARQVETAQVGLARVRVERFPATDHDIHLHRPAQLAESLLTELTSGIWSTEQATPKGFTQER